MDLQLTGKRALVTGSTRGIGESIARCLAAEGVAVAVHGRSARAGQEVTADILAKGGKAIYIAADIGLPADVDRLARESVEALGGIDILVNNAANWDLQSFWNTPVEQWERLYNEQVISAVRLVHALVPAMRERAWGRVINIASGAATMPWAHGADYNAAKAALLNFSVSLAQNMVGFGVTVNSVSPGPILTPGLETEFRKAARAKDWPEAAIDDFGPLEVHSASYDGGLAPNPTGHIGRPEDIGTMCAFLASPRAGFVNGANLRVDGAYIRCVN